LEVTSSALILGEFEGHWSLVMISGQLAHSQFYALRGVAHCWKMNPVGSRKLLKEMII